MGLGPLHRRRRSSKVGSKMLEAQAEAKEIEVYEPSRCFRCQALVYLKGFENEHGWHTVAFDYYRNRRHLCVHRRLYEIAAATAAATVNAMAARGSKR